MPQRHCEPHSIESLGHPPPDLGALNSQVFASERDFVADARQDGLGVRILKNEANPTSRPARCIAVESQRASLVPLLVTAEDARETCKQRALAGARRTEQQDALSGFDVQVEARNGVGGPAGVTPAPTGRADADPPLSVDQEPVRPEANRDSAPVAARPRTANQLSRPTSAPDAIALIA